MAARFPQSATSVAYQIAAAYSSKIKAIAWAATADSVHVLYPGETATTVQTRSTSGASFNATEGRITGAVGGDGTTQYFSFSKSGGLGITEAGPLTHIVSYFGDVFAGAPSTRLIGSGSAVATSSASRIVAASYNITPALAGASVSAVGNGVANNVAAAMVIALRSVPSDPISRNREWLNGTELTGNRGTNAPTSSATIGDTGTPLYFGGTWLVSGATYGEGEAWIVASDLSDADLDAITADPSIAIEAYSSPSDLSSGIDLADFVLSGDFAVGALSQLSSGFTLDDFALSGVLGLAPGIVTTNPFKNWTGTLLPGTTIPNVVFLKLDRTMPLSLTNQVTAGDAVMTITNAALVTGTYYIMVSYNADGSAIGAELVLAA